MAARTKPATPRAQSEFRTEPGPPWTLQSRQEHIKLLGERVEGYVRLMVRLGNQAGISTEARDRAVVLFHERLIIVEKELARIHENLQLE